MALFGGMGRGGLFGVKQPWDEKPMGGIPGVGGQMSGGYPTAPKPEGKGGVFGSGMSGEDIINLLMRASALANGDYGSASQISQAMQSPMIEKAKREAERDDYVWKKGVDREYAVPDQPAMVDNLRAFQNMSEEDRQALQAMYDITNPVVREGKDGLPYAHPRGAASALDPNDWEPYDPGQGGATVTPPRTFPPRLRR